MKAEFVNYPYTIKPDVFYVKFNRTGKELKFESAKFTEDMEKVICEELQNSNSNCAEIYCEEGWEGKIYYGCIKY